MKVTSEDLKSLYQEGTARSAEGRIDCLSPETMMRMVMEELSLEERGRMADHISTCANCAWEFQVVRALKPWVAETGQAFSVPAEQISLPDPTARKPALHSVQTGIAHQPAFWQRAADILWPERRHSALAAGLLLLIVFALGGFLILDRLEENDRITSLNEELAKRDLALNSANQALNEVRQQLEDANLRRDQALATTNSKQYVEEITRLRKTIGEIGNPQLEIPLVELDMVRGGAIETAMPIEIPRTANFLTLILNFNDRKQYSTFGVEIFDRQGSLVWRGNSASRSHPNKLNLTLPRQFFSSGSYNIKLFGIQKDKKAPIASYNVTISYK
jgi:hypothetical protein